MRKMKRAKRWIGVLLSGFIGAGACFSGAAVTGINTELTAYAAGDVAINATNFPDENFRKYVSESIDTDGDGNLSEREITACENIDCSYHEIYSLKGIEHFTVLKDLTCHNCNLSSLDVSKNPALEQLWCDYNNLSSLDVSRNPALKYLSCIDNNLSNLDVSKNPALTYLSCIDNNLSNLDVSKNPALTLLRCGSSWRFDGSNNLSSLDVSKNPALEQLWCDHNNLSCLDISKNPALELLTCGYNNLSSLDVSKNTMLTELMCYHNSLSSLDVSKNAGLEILSCSHNNLSSLDVSKNAALIRLDCDDQAKAVTATNGEILLSALSTTTTASNITNIKGATLSGNKLTNITGNTITYDYKTGYGDETMDVTLNVKKEAVPDKVTLDKKLLVLDKGKSGRLTATVTPAEAKNKTITWSSSNTNVATVDASGNIKAINHGTAKITAKTTNGKTAECEVRVNFIDVTNPKDWYYKAVYWAAEKGITTGTDGKFFHADNCTREQAITFLWRMAGKPNPKSMTSKFSDVKDSKRYSYKAIMWGSENGIITGTNGKFYPTDTCTREQIVTMLWRQAGQPAPKNMTSKFKDVKDSKRYSYKAIMWAQENGITTGTNGLFSPTGLCKRREIVTFIYRYKN